MASLPSFFILQSGSKYLSLTENVPATLPSGFLKFDEEQIWSPRVKFAAEPAKSGDGQFVHIRSLYNNKYLVKTQIDETKSWIFVASAKKTEEDPSKDSCTLFEPFSLKDDGPKSVRLRQVQTQNSVTLAATSLDGEAQQGLLALSSTSGPVFSVIDRASLVVLPSQVAFISYDNSYYLQSMLIEGHGYQRFDSGLDIAVPRVAKKLIPSADGNYRIEDEYWSQSLTRHGTWIWADSPETNLSMDTMFSFVNIEKNVFGLRSLGNNNFCGPLTSEGKTNCLNAQYPTLTNKAKLIVEERVTKREITDIEYRLSDSRIYGEQPIEVDTQTTTNFLTDSQIISTLKFRETNSRTTSWTNSQSISFGVSVSIKVTIIPFISEVGIEMHTDSTSTYEWGESETVTTSRLTSHAVTVPPLMTYMVTYIATKGVCDVPFNYTQRDLLTTGEWVETKKDDGLFTGVNSYKFEYETKKIKVEDTRGK